jgi:undecaprenyl pyrophosphate synthase
MSSEPEQPSPIEKLKALKRHKEELARRVSELENMKIRLDDQFVSLDTTTELSEAANISEDIVKNNDEFRRKFCVQYDEIISRPADIAELIADILLTINSANLPALTVPIPAWMAIKISKLGVELYCKDLKK